MSWVSCRSQNCLSCTDPVHGSGSLRTRQCGCRHDDVAKERREVTYDTIGSRMMDPSIRWRVEGVVCMMQVANEKAVRLESGWSRRSKVCMIYV
jgi:hypothetical protein